MKVLVSCLALVALYCAVVDAKTARRAPKVQLYSRNPDEFGRENTLICHVSQFHPPDITIQLLQDGVELSGSEQTDLAFKPDWQFHLTRSVRFTPQAGTKFTCKVDHGGKVTDYNWDPNM